MMGTPLQPPFVTAQLRDFLDNEQHEHDVTLSSFLIAKYEVDQLTWENVMLSNPSLRQGGSLPVHNVSWKECFEFCEKTDLSLPTEAQWEYACRAGSKAFSFGEKIDARQVLEKISARQESLDPAGMVDAQSKQPNAFGIHHMLGNVWEWCLYHYFDKAFYERPEATLKNQKDDSPSQYRVLRGGVFRQVRIVRWEDEPRAEGFEGFRLAYYPLP